MIFSVYHLSILTNMSLVGDRMLALKTGQGREKSYTRNGPRGPAGLGIPFAVDRMQNLVEILGQPFAEMLIWIPKFKNVA